MQGKIKLILKHERRKARGTRRTQGTKVGRAQGMCGMRHVRHKST